MRRVAAILALALGACAADEQLSPVPTGGSAATFDMFSTELSDDMYEQALFALEADAWRRELRFLDAANPGHLFSTTRVRQAEIDAGQWNSDDLYQLGGQLFTTRFTPAIGFGGADLPPFGRFQTGARGGPDAFTCADCHRVGGPAGAGDASDNAYLDGDGVHQSAALERNPRSLVGAGIIELLAKEMTAELHAQRSAAIAAAHGTGQPQRVVLVAKGINFGVLTVRADGSLDTREIDGVDTDLVIKPFGWKGTSASVREMVEDELALHHGMQSDYLVAHGSPARLGPFGGKDPDGDGVVSEIWEGQVTALTLFVALQEVPQIEIPVTQLVATDPTYLESWAAGKVMFDDLGCAGCHVVSLPLDSTEFVLTSRGGGPPLRIDLAEHGASPRIERDASGRFQVYLFSDLKRHPVGADLTEDRSYRGVLASQFVTPPLWGLVRSRPYLHDGRAPTFVNAIRAHGGAAQQARDAFVEMGTVEAGALRMYLTSLTRAPRMVSP